MLATSGKRRQTVNALFGVVCETEISPGTNSDDSIPSIPTSWISIVRRRSLPSNLMVQATVIFCVRQVVTHEMNSSPAWKLPCCDFRTIKFAKSLIAFWKRSGSRWKNVAPKIPHLHPLPFTKGEAPQKRRGVIRSRFTDRESDSCEIQRDTAL